MTLKLVRNAQAQKRPIMNGRHGRAGLAAPSLVTCLMLFVFSFLGEPETQFPWLTEAVYAFVPPERIESRDAQAAIVSVRDYLLRHAPYKQVSSSGAPNAQIGRTPGAACDAITFFAAYSKAHPLDLKVPRRMEELADWVAGLQVRDQTLPSYGAVPSTPDLPDDRRNYFYSMDAAICASAMLKLYDVTGRPEDKETAARFGAFLMRMHEEHRRRVGVWGPAALCEFVAGSRDAIQWNCDAYVKTLTALPVLRALAIEQDDPTFEAAARSIKAFLTPGLERFWEYAEAQDCGLSPCAPRWRRVRGPRGTPNIYVYGDTIAYALRGLYEYEGPTGIVRGVYERAAELRGPRWWLTRFDAALALPGYIEAASSRADGRSGYYDLVTAGILYDLRAALDPRDALKAHDLVDALPIAAADIQWGLRYNRRRFVGGHADTTTLSELGVLMLRLEHGAPEATTAARPPPDAA